jgi:glycosyltransferase involved in cell wall biosynthesis
VSAIRVLHCPHTVGGHPQGLARAERRLGLESWAVSFEPPLAGTPVDEVLFDPRSSRWTQEVKRFGLLSRALREFDVVHFNFGSSLFPRRYPGTHRGLRSAYARLFELRDLALLKRAGKAIFVTYQGDDARPGAGEAVDRRKREWIARFDRYADRIYALNPDLLRVLPDRAEFLPYASVDPDEWRSRANAGSRDRPLVVHAPSDREIKGTRHLLAALDELEREGVQFELRLVESMPRSAARRVYEEADVIVDQLLIGWYGGIAVEAMALEKPVVAYLDEDDLRFLPSEMRSELPVVSASASTVAETLRDLLTAPEARRSELGRLGRAFVERWHDPMAVATRLKHDYERVLAAA